MRKIRLLKESAAEIINSVDETITDAPAENQEAEVWNALKHPEIYYARHMHPGVVRYKDEDVLVRTDAIKKMAKSFNGKPVFVHHQKVELENLQEKADGYVTDTFYNEADGWCWSKLLIVSDGGHAAVKKGWGVSNAYMPTETSKGGTFQNVTYNREILNGHYTHLAIVPDPRYEDSIILTPDEFKTYQDEKKREIQELHNSKTKPEGKPTMLKFFKTQKEEVQLEDLDKVHVELANGKTMPLSEMINAVAAADEEADKKKKEAEKASEEKQNAADLGAEVTVGSTTMTVGELKQKYMRLCEKKNSVDGDDDKKTETTQDNKEGDAAKDGKNDSETDPEKTNSKEGEKHFEELQNAHLQGKFPEQVADTSMDQVARGQARYGSQKA